MVSDSARNRMENSDVPGHDFKKLCPRILSSTIYNSWDFRSALREKKMQLSQSQFFLAETGFINKTILAQFLKCAIWDLICSFSHQFYAFWIHLAVLCALLIYLYKGTVNLQENPTEYLSNRPICNLGKNNYGDNDNG